MGQSHSKPANNPTETHALVDNNIQASSKDILIQFGIHLPLTMECK